MAPFLFIATLIVGGAFANEGGPKCVADNGIKHCVEKVVANGKQEFKVNE